MDLLERLLATEEIRRLKGRYFRYCDTQMLDEYLEVFAPDADLVYDLDHSANGKPKQMRLRGRGELEEFCRAAWGTEMIWSAHHGMTAEIEICSPVEARAIWAMQDIVEMRDSDYHGFGHYHETYTKVDGAWRIQTLRLTRTRVINTPKI